MFLWFIIFFQAEDGIRDYKVTGVQTCALPISTALSIALLTVAYAIEFSYTVGKASAPYIKQAVARSEERRVGKECRSRREPCH